MYDIESVAPLMSDVKNVTAYRFSDNGKRYYFTCQDTIESVKFYPSVTTVIAGAAPMSFGMKNLLGQMGATEYYKMMRYKADYGTVLHILLAEYFKFMGFSDINYAVRSAIEEVMSRSKAPDLSYLLWDYQLKKDLLGIIKWARDCNVKPLAIEVCGTYETDFYRYAGAIDLICELDVEVLGYWGEVYKTGDKKGRPKATKLTQRKTAVVDFKSGKDSDETSNGSFYPDYLLQMVMYKNICEQSLGVKIDTVINVKPKNWISNPGYDSKDWVNDRNDLTDILETIALKTSHMASQYFIDYKDPHDVVEISGAVNGNIEECYRILSAHEYCFKRVSKPVYELGL